MTICLTDKRHKRPFGFTQCGIFTPSKSGNGDFGNAVASMAKQIMARYSFSPRLIGVGTDLTFLQKPAFSLKAPIRFQWSLKPVLQFFPRLTLRLHVLLYDLAASEMSEGWQLLPNQFSSAASSFFQNRSPGVLAITQIITPFQSDKTFNRSQKSDGIYQNVLKILTEKDLFLWESIRETLRDRLPAPYNQAYILPEKTWKRQNHKQSGASGITLAYPFRQILLPKLANGINTVHSPIKMALSNQQLKKDSILRYAVAQQSGLSRGFSANPSIHRSASQIFHKPTSLNTVFLAGKESINDFSWPPITLRRMGGSDISEIDFTGKLYQIITPDTTSLYNIINQQLLFYNSIPRMSEDIFNIPPKPSSAPPFYFTGINAFFHATDKSTSEFSRKVERALSPILFHKYSSDFTVHLSSPGTINNRFFRNMFHLWIERTKGVLRWSGCAVERSSAEANINTYLFQALSHEYSNSIDNVFFKPLYFSPNLLSVGNDIFPFSKISALAPPYYTNLLHFYYFLRKPFTRISLNKLYPKQMHQPINFWAFGYPVSQKSFIEEIFRKTEREWRFGFQSSNGLCRISGYSRWAKTDASQYLFQYRSPNYTKFSNSPHPKLSFFAPNLLNQTNEHQLFTTQLAPIISPHTHKRISIFSWLPINQLLRFAQNTSTIKFFDMLKLMGHNVVAYHLNPKTYANVNFRELKQTGGGKSPIGRNITGKNKPAVTATAGHTLIHFPLPSPSYNDCINSILREPDLYLLNRLRMNFFLQSNAMLHTQIPSHDADSTNLFNDLSNQLNVLNQQIVSPLIINRRRLLAPNSTYLSFTPKYFSDKLFLKTPLILRPDTPEWRCITKKTHPIGTHLLGRVDKQFHQLSSTNHKRFVQSIHHEPMLYFFNLLSRGSKVLTFPAFAAPQIPFLTKAVYLYNFLAAQLDKPIQFVKKSRDEEISNRPTTEASAYRFIPKNLIDPLFQKKSFVTVLGTHDAPIIYWPVDKIGPTQAGSSGNSIDDSFHKNRRPAYTGYINATHWKLISDRFNRFNIENFFQLRSGINTPILPNYPNIANFRKFLISQQSRVAKTIRGEGILNRFFRLTNEKVFSFEKLHLLNDWTSWQSTINLSKKTVGDQKYINQAELPHYTDRKSTENKTSSLSLQYLLLNFSEFKDKINQKQLFYHSYQGCIEKMYSHISSLTTQKSPYYHNPIFYYLLFENPYDDPTKEIKREWIPKIFQQVSKGSPVSQLDFPLSPGDYFRKTPDAWSKDKKKKGRMQKISGSHGISVGSDSHLHQRFTIPYNNFIKTVNPRQMFYMFNRFNNRLITQIIHYPNPSPPPYHMDSADPLYNFPEINHTDFTKDVNKNNDILHMFRRRSRFGTACFSFTCGYLERNLIPSQTIHAERKINIDAINGIRIRPHHRLPYDSETPPTPELLNRHFSQLLTAGLTGAAFQPVLIPSPVDLIHPFMTALIESSKPPLPTPVFSFRLVRSLHPSHTKKTLFLNPGVGPHIFGRWEGHDGQLIVKPLAYFLPRELKLLAESHENATQSGLRPVQLTLKHRFAAIFSPPPQRHGVMFRFQSNLFAPSRFITPLRTWFPDTPIWLIKFVTNAGERGKHFFIRAEKNSHLKKTLSILEPTQKYHPGKTALEGFDLDTVEIRYLSQFAPIVLPQTINPRIPPPVENAMIILPKIIRTCSTVETASEPILSFTDPVMQFRQMAVAAAPPTSNAILSHQSSRPSINIQLPSMTHLQPQRTDDTSSAFHHIEKRIEEENKRFAEQLQKQLSAVEAKASPNIAKLADNIYNIIISRIKQERTRRGF